MKKIFALIFVLIVLSACTAAYAEDIETNMSMIEDSVAIDSALETLISKAVEVTGDQKADIYSTVKIAENLTDYDFEKPSEISLFSAEENALKIYNCENNLSVNNGVLSGNVTIYFVNDLTDDAHVIMGIYQNHKLEYVKIEDISSNGYMDFSDISANISETDYEICFFVWNDELMPLRNKFVYTASDNIRVYADTVNTMVDVPTYIYNDEILADINVFYDLGAVVEYDSDNEVLWIRKNNQKIGMYLYDNVMYVFKGGNRYTSNADYITYVENNTIYVPLKAICNNLGFIVKYNEQNRKVELFSNEVLHAQKKYCNFVDDSVGLYWSIPNLNYYSADINNGLIYFAVPESNYIYVTDGTNVIKYNVGCEPAYILSEGDYIYFNHYENSISQIRRIDKNNNSIKTLFTLPKYIESSWFYYYNGNIYLRDGSQANNAFTGARTASYNNHGHGDPFIKHETIVLDRDIVCNIVSDGNYTSSLKLFINIVGPNGTISSDIYTVYGNGNKINNYIVSRYNDYGLYLRSETGLTYSIKVNLDTNYNIKSISSATDSQWDNAGSLENHSQSKFATTKLTNDYRFVVNNNMITAINRTSGSATQLINLKYPCNQLLFANDDYLVYCVHNVEAVNYDGNIRYRITGATGLYLVNIREGTTSNIYSTYAYN